MLSCSHCALSVQALLIRALLEYAQSSEVWLPYGLALVGGIFLMELICSWTMALMWAVNYRTAARLRGAALTFAFEKILRLRSTKEISTGEVRKRPCLPSYAAQCMCMMHIAYIICGASCIVCVCVCILHCCCFFISLKGAVCNF